MVKFEGTNYLLCALGDGSLFYFVLNVDAVAAAGKLNQKVLFLDVYNNLRQNQKLL